MNLPFTTYSSRLAYLASITAVSFAAGLYSVVAFKWLAFSLVPTSAFVAVLLMGMPVGAYLAAVRWMGAKEGQSKAIYALLVSALVCPALFLAIHRLDLTFVFLAFAGRNSYVAFVLLLAVIGLLAACFFPLFVSWGAAEFVLLNGIQRHRFGGARLAYVLILGSTLAAYAMVRLGLSRWGLMPFWGLATLCLLVGWQLQTRRCLGKFQFIWALAGLGILGNPGLDRWYAGRLSDNLINPTAAHRDKRVVGPSVWTPYVHIRLSLVPGSIYAGDYNGNWIWLYWNGKAERDPALRRWGKAAFEGKEVAIIGAGGGYQASLLRDLGAAKIYAVDIIGEIFPLLRQPPYSDLNRGLYNDSRVITVAMDGRRFLESYETSQKFDVILLSNTETGQIGLRSLFEGSSTVFTKEAMSAMRARLKPEGLLIIEKGSVWDFRGQLFQSYFRAMTEAGFHVVGGRPRFTSQTRKPWEIPFPTNVGGLPDYVSSLAAAEMERVRAFVLVGRLDRPWILDPVLEQAAQEEDFDIQFAPQPDGPPATTDENPFKASVLSGLFTSRHAAIGIALGVMVSALLLAALRRRLRVGLPAKPARFVLLALLVGANLVMVENLLIYRMIRWLPNPLDAVYGGILVSLSAVLAGNLVPTSFIRRPRALVALTGVIFAASVFCLGQGWTGTGVLFSAICLAVTGRMFPALMQDAPPARLLGVFILDATGAFLGSVLALLLPVSLGLGDFSWVVLGVLWATLLAWWAYNSVREPESPAPL